MTSQNTEVPSAYIISIGSSLNKLFFKFNHEDIHTGWHEQGIKEWEHSPGTPETTQPQWSGKMFFINSLLNGRDETTAN
jgi:hypothetical protein